MKHLWCTCLLTVLAVGCSKNVEIIAHRGASYLAPENTMASVTKAWQLGADAVEVDVYLSKDNRMVVIHDKDTKRTAGVELDIAQATSVQLRQLDAGSHKDVKYAGEKIPFIEEVIAGIPAGKKLYIEIKCDETIVPYLQQAIEQSGKRQQIVVISFNFDVVKEVKHTMPDIPVYWLAGTRRDKETKEYLPHDPAWIAQVRQYGIDGLDVHYAGLTESFAKDALSAGLGLYVWTVNDPIEALRLQKLGVHGITTDRPAWLKEQMKNKRGK
ncbi:MAG: glycerophosphodiester phosphodiesterase [Sedimentisphaerales bacterium]|nr:glycerophosphodiester phosphodiesterase [Sedimentisphaerales bacterium]